MSEDKSKFLFDIPGESEGDSWMDINGDGFGNVTINAQDYDRGNICKVITFERAVELRNQLDEWLNYHNAQPETKPIPLTFLGFPVVIDKSLKEGEWRLVPQNEAE